jgi:hypothetical protein
MDTALHVLILSLVALHVAALAGGGIGLLVMRWLGYDSEISTPTQARESLP